MGSVRLKVKSRGYMVREGVHRDEGFGARLREAMSRAGVRPGDLARTMGVHPVTVTRWRRGELPDDLRLPQLASCVGVALMWLKSGEGPQIAVGRDRAPLTPIVAETGRTEAGRLRHLTARLAFLRDQLRAYRDLGQSPPPPVLEEWLRLTAEPDEAPGGADD